jgi:hypothetical protein
MPESTPDPGMRASMSLPLANPHTAPTGYTRVNNSIFDLIMPTLSGNGLKVLLVALRQTWGWKDAQSPTGRKQSDAISYSQFMAKGGMARATVARAIQECLDAGYLVRRRNGRGHVYALNTAFVPTSSETEPLTGSETEHTKGKGNSGGGDATGVLSLLKRFQMHLDQEVRELAARYSLQQIEYGIRRARQQATRNPPGLLRCWMRSGHMPLPPPKEGAHAAHQGHHQELNDDAQAFAAYRAAQQGGSRV